MKIIKQRKYGYYSNVKPKWKEDLGYKIPDKIIDAIKDEDRDYEELIQVMIAVLFFIMGVVFKTFMF